MKVRAKYLFGCDGARSKVRQCIAGGGAGGDGERKGKIVMQGEATDIIWVGDFYWSAMPPALKAHSFFAARVSWMRELGQHSLTSTINA